MAIGMHMDQEEVAGPDTARPSGSGLQPRSQPIDSLEPGAAATASVEDEELWVDVASTSTSEFMYCGLNGSSV